MSNRCKTDNAKPPMAMPMRVWLAGRITSPDCRYLLNESDPDRTELVEAPLGCHLIMAIAISFKPLQRLPLPGNPLFFMRQPVMTTESLFKNPAKSDFNGHMPTRFIRRKELCYLTGLSPSSVYLLMKQNKFPASIRLPGGKAVAWQLSAVEEWQRQCIAAASQPANDA